MNSDEDLFCFPVGIVEIHPHYDGLKVPVACARFICHPIRFPACFCRTGRSFSPSNDETRSQCLSRESLSTEAGPYLLSKRSSSPKRQVGEALSSGAQVNILDTAYKTVVNMQ